jgi:hypothetical protein
MYDLAGLLKKPEDFVTAASENTGSKEQPSEEEVQALLKKAMAAHGGAEFKDVNEDKTVQAQLLGVELWEAVCWRRGSLRYVACRISGFLSMLISCVGFWPVVIALFQILLRVHDHQSFSCRN